MLDLGWIELLVVAVIMVLVIGPKELPQVMRTLGIWMGKARSLAREFQSYLDEAVKDAELDDVKKTVDGLKNKDAGRAFDQAVDPDGSLREGLSEDLKTAKASGSGADAPAKAASQPPAPSADGKPADPKPAGAKSTGAKSTGAKPSGGRAKAGSGGGRKTTTPKATPKATPKTRPDGGADGEPS
ncbi:Sec-independent protein translocase protein TatB [Roseospirillum parvum]|uniref:Sec-independent protein translocase protein TatB n=1 Tax=Roseospirillum parvum TaxID=83401 RepID=A0A1G7YID8_9PROT|nr:Sec-independent protein translocase protein TatB [Roseospirillum parvum]SDG96066.1 sec-independent protein translocase protein TatB [Roseospirillum parvum]